MGSGRPLVFLHGFAMSLDTWRFLTTELKKEYRLLLLDLKGHGLSERPRDEKYAPQDHMRVVGGLINHLGLEDVVIVGHSFGSVVALTVALESQRGSSSGPITGLLLIAGSVDVKNLPFVLRVLRAPLMGWLSLKLTSVPFRTRLMLKRGYHDDSKVTESLVELYAQYQRIAGSGYALMRTAEQIVPPDYPRLKEALAKLEIPVMNIWGEHDKVIPRSSVESLRRLLPNCALVTVERTGHVPQEERPEKVISLLREFLRSH
jgi:pimeloyl-ACP methyl ester carboxylesterase